MKKEKINFGEKTRKECAEHVEKREIIEHQLSKCEDKRGSDLNRKRVLSKSIKK